MTAFTSSLMMWVSVPVAGATADGLNVVAVLAAPSFSKRISFILMTSFLFPSLSVTVISVFPSVSVVLTVVVPSSVFVVSTFEPSEFVTVSDEVSLMTVPFASSVFVLSDSIFVPSILVVLSLTSVMVVFVSESVV